MGELTTIVLVLAAIYLGLSNRDLRRRVRRLEAASPAQGDPPSATRRWPDAHAGGTRDALEASDDPAGAAPAPETAGVRRGPGWTPAAWRLARWLAANWFLAVSALSLALAGLYAAQYAAAQGLLAPWARLALAAGLGALFVAAGEAIRRRSGDGAGDEPGTATAYLPSVFSGAGVVTLYGAALAARALYAMVSAEAALALLAAVAALSVVLGWFHGPLLALVGILGAVAAPFLVGGQGGSAALLHAYLAVVAAAGLVSDMPRRRAGVAQTAVLAPLAGGVLVSAGLGGTATLIALAGALAVLYAVLHGGALRPALHGRSIALRAARRAGGTAAASGATAASGADEASGVLSATGTAGATSTASATGAGRLFLPLFWALCCGIVALGASEAPVTALAVSAALLAATALWAARAEAALDLAILTALGFGAAVWLAPELAPVAPVAPVDPTDALPAPDRTGFFAAMILGAALAALSAWRSGPGTPAGRGWAALACALALGVPILLEIVATPAAAFGRAAWPGMVLALAALATLAAERAARADGADRRRAGLAAVAAVTLIALALFGAISGAALSAALGVLLVAAALADARLGLPALSGAIQAGAAALIYRAVVDPGPAAAFGGTGVDLFLGHAVPVLMALAAWELLRGAARPSARAALEGAALVVGGTGFTVWIVRVIDDRALLEAPGELHWAAGLVAAVWLAAGIVSLRTMDVAARTAPVADGGEDGGGRAARLVRRAPFVLRGAAGAVTLLTGLAALALVATAGNPLVSDIAGPIRGLPFASTLLLAYALPAAVLATGAWVLRRRGRWAAAPFGALAAASALLYAVVSIAHAWRGPAPWAGRMGDGELWSYSLLIVAVGAALLIQGLRRDARAIRLSGNAVLVLAIAKVFGIDAAGLDGLARAGSFLLLGLALAGLAWLNRLLGGPRAGPPSRSGTTGRRRPAA